MTESEPYLRIDLGDGLIENKQYYFDLAERIGLTPKDIGFGKSQENIQIDLQAVEFSDLYKDNEKVPQVQDLTLALEDSEPSEWGDDSRLFVRAELLDTQTGETVIHTPFIVDKPTETDFITWWQDNYEAIDKQIRSSDEVVALEKELDFRKNTQLLKDFWQDIDDSDKQVLLERLGGYPSFLDYSSPFELNEYGDYDYPLSSLPIEIVEVLKTNEGYDFIETAYQENSLSVDDAPFVQEFIKHANIQHYYSGSYPDEQMTYEINGVSFATVDAERDTQKPEDLLESAMLSSRFLSKKIADKSQSTIAELSEDAQKFWLGLSSEVEQTLDKIVVEESSQVEVQQSQETSIPTKEEDNSRLAQAQRKLERLEREKSEAIEQVYAHQKLTNGQPMNDKRNGPAWFKRRDELDRKARNLDSELEEHRERVVRLENQAFNKTHGLNKQGTGLEMSVGNIDNIKRAIETGELIEGNKAKLSGETIKKYQKELVKLEEIKQNSEKAQGIMSDATKALIASGDINQWTKQPTLYFINSLKKVALELDAETGEFKISQKYAPKTQADKDFVEGLLNRVQSEKTKPLTTLQEVLDDFDNQPELLSETSELEKSLKDTSRYDGVDKDSPAVAELQAKMGLGTVEPDFEVASPIENDEVEIGKITTQISDGFVTMAQKAAKDSELDKIELTILDKEMTVIQSFSVGKLNVESAESKEEKREQTAYHLLGELAQASEKGQSNLSAINIISTFSLLNTPEVSVTFENTEKIEALAKAFSKVDDKPVDTETKQTITPYKSKDVTIEQMMLDATKQIREYTQNPEDLKSYLDFMSNFPQYSAKNNALLRRQWQGATAVATFDQWAKLGDKLGIAANDLERDRVTFKNSKTGEEKVIENESLSVKKGEKSNIYLFRPQTMKVIPVLDDNGKQRKNDSGQPLFKSAFKATAVEKAQIESGTLKVESLPRMLNGKAQFSKFPVYDITQTNLKPSSYPKAMPNRKVDYNIDMESTNNMLRGLKTYSDKIQVPVFVDEDNVLGNAKGAFQHSPITGEQNIIMNPRNTETDNIATLIHELAHATLHNPLREYQEDMPRSLKELEAEMTSYIVSKHFGMDTSEDSIGYMAGWSKQLTVLSDEELEHSFTRIGGTVKTIVKSIEREFELSPVKSKDVALNNGHTINQPKPKGR